MAAIDGALGAEPLLTLLAVPVFYSYFEDLGEHPLWHRMARREQILFGHLGRVAKILGSRVGLSSAGSSEGGLHD